MNKKGLVTGGNNILKGLYGKTLNSKDRDVWKKSLADIDKMLDGEDTLTI